MALEIAAFSFGSLAYQAPSSRLPCQAAAVVSTATKRGVRYLLAGENGNMYEFDSNALVQASWPVVRNNLLRSQLHCQAISRRIPR